jgi:hypothetical protein
MTVLPSMRTIALMLLAAALFGFNSVLAFRAGSNGRGGFYAGMSLLWLLLGLVLNQKRRRG